MDINTTNKTKLLFPELSYKIVGLCFDVHNELGQYAREKQYAEALEQRLFFNKINYRKEFSIGNSGNVVDFLIENKMILELKAVRRLTREHFRQTQNYLQISRLRLALLINFREPDLKPRRIIKID